MTMLESSPTFSVVIPSYNRAGLVVRAVRSAITQSTPPREIIVVDDGSTDDTEQRLREFATRLRYVRQERGGPARARNLGVKLATSRWIAFLDSDDLWERTYLEVMGRAIVATEGRAGVYFANASIAGSNPPVTLWEQAGFTIAGRHAFLEDGSDLVLREIQPMLLQFSVVDRERFLRLGGFREELMTAEDTHLFIRCGLDGALCAVSVLAGTLTNDDSPANRLTGVFDTKAVGRWKNTVQMQRDILDHHPDLPRRHRRALRNQLAESYWRLARREWALGEAPKAVGDALRALMSFPGIALSLVQRTILRRRPARRIP
jgi:glycosyltransferase involved in cell wall biosynthesis